MSPPAVHDVWTRILDLVSDLASLKRCSLVCQSWHLYLQPRVLSNVRYIGTESDVTKEEIQVLRPVSHRIRILRLQHWGGSTPPPLMLTILPGIFRHLTTMKLVDVTFLSFDQVSLCFAFLITTLKTLSLVDCRLGWAYAILEAFEDQLEGRDVKSTTTIIHSYHIGLHELCLHHSPREWSSVMFNSVMLLWSTISPTLSSLRVLRVRIKWSDVDYRRHLFAFISHPSCKLEELAIVWHGDHDEREPRDDGMYSSNLRSSNVFNVNSDINFSSTSIKKLVVRSKRHGTIHRVFDLVHGGFLPSLRQLRLHLTDFQEYRHFFDGKEDPDVLLTQLSFHQRLPSINSVQLSIGLDGQAKHHTDSSLLYLLLSRSKFLQVAHDNNLLTLTVAQVNPQ
jgi:hypothetical protein